MTWELVPIGDDDNVTNVTCVARGAIEQSTIENNSATDPGGDDHGDVVANSDRRSDRRSDADGRPFPGHRS